MGVAGVQAPAFVERSGTPPSRMQSRSCRRGSEVVPALVVQLTSGHTETEGKPEGCPVAGFTDTWARSSGPGISRLIAELSRIRPASDEPWSWDGPDALVSDDRRFGWSAPTRSAKHQRWIGMACRWHSLSPSWGSSAEPGEGPTAATVRCPRASRRPCRPSMGHPPDQTRGHGPPLPPAVRR